jgi:hypothetical protein
MSSTASSSGGQNDGTWTNYFKGLLGGSTTSSQQQSTAVPSSAQASAPKPLNVGHLRSQDSIPEIVSTPTDVGIWEVGHKGEKLTWKRFFESGSSQRSNPQNSQSSDSS